MVGNVASGSVSSKPSYETHSTWNTGSSSGITPPKLPFQWQQVPGSSRIAGLAASPNEYTFMLVSSSS